MARPRRPLLPMEVVLTAMEHQFRHSQAASRSDLVAVATRVCTARFGEAPDAAFFVEQLLKALLSRHAIERVHTAPGQLHYARTERWKNDPRLCMDLYGCPRRSSDVERELDALAAQLA